jgi:hypothetical protein
VLGPETEVQLSDLAGNAMSVPVVSAAMLAAICAPQLRRQRERDRKVLLNDFALSQKYDAAKGAVLAQRGDLYKQEGGTEGKDCIEVFGAIARDLALDAYRSSVLCTCETSGTTTNDPQILECASCGMVVCHDCSGRYQVSSHLLEEIDVNGTDGRPPPHMFERKLRCAVPSILRLGQGWESALENGQGLESYSFQLQQVDRKKGYWQLTYGAWEDHGSARQVAEIRFVLGRTGTLDTDLGVAGYIRCFAPAIRHDSPFRGRLKDSARFILKVDDPCQASQCWELPDKSTTCNLELVGSELVDSQRVLIGLNNEAARSLRGYDVKKAFQPPVKSRNSLTFYHSKWKTWPGTLVVSGDVSGRINGTYNKMTCTHTIVLSALWRRNGADERSPMYLFYRPEVLRTNLDVAVFAPTPSYADNMEVCELHDWIPENALENSTQKTEASFMKWKRAPENLKVYAPDPRMAMIVPVEPFHERVCALSRQENTAAPILCEMGGLSKEHVASLLEYSETDNSHYVTAIDLFGRSATRNAKLLSIIAAPSLLKYAAEERLSLSLSTWYELVPSSTKFGHCKINVPPRPAERWTKISDREGVFERVYDAEESNEYYQSLFNRPRAFEVNVDKSMGKLVIRMNPYVAAHRAAAQLGGKETGSIKVDYCLSELSSMGEPPTREFHVPNSDAYDETVVDGLVIPLYKRQAKALTRMLAIERECVFFSEEERSEVVLPGIGWCLIARAAKSSPLRGGVLGGK